MIPLVKVLGEFAQVLDTRGAFVALPTSDSELSHVKRERELEPRFTSFFPEFFDGVHITTRLFYSTQIVPRSDQEYTSVRLKNGQDSI